MLKLLIVETSRILESSSVAHIRNAVILQERLRERGIDCDITDVTVKQTGEIKQYDIILFSYATGRADFSEIDKIVAKQKRCRIGFLTNEFELFANQYVKDRMDFIITNFEQHGVKKAHKFRDFLMVNLNSLFARERNLPCVKKYGMCYYGTYRKYRIDYFRKYFGDGVVVSTSKKNWQDFVDDGISCKVTEKFAWNKGQETLNLFRTSLYIEDSKTHTCYNFLANRFYEGLYCNVPMLFDVSCRNTIEKSGYDIDDYFVVSSREEAIEKTENLDAKRVERYLRNNTYIAISELDKAISQIVEFLIMIDMEMT